MPKDPVNDAWPQGPVPERQLISTEFEQIAARLQLKPDQYATSTKLREWVEKNWREKYVPEKLLRKWRLGEYGFPDAE